MDTLSIFTNEFTLKIITAVSVIAILVAFTFSWIYINHKKQAGQLATNKRWIEQLPSLISTLGVIGTFLGITLGLLGFNTAALDKSIPLLLDGLKTAFFTSLAGMVGSLILSKVVSSCFDEEEGGISDSNVAAAEVVKAVREMSSVTTDTLNKLQKQISQQADKQNEFYASMLSGVAFINTSVGNVEKLAQQIISTQDEISVEVKSLGDKLHEETIGVNENLTETNGLLNHALRGMADNHTAIIEQSQVVRMIVSGMSNMDRNIGEMVDVVSGISSTQDEISIEVKSFGEKLHGEVIEIEDKMSETNELLSQKFNEFTELLKKSNTEALVDVMKKVTEEFQKQMSTLIGKLVQENFEQLNKSVAQLNKWQHENKDMIVALTKQYKDMAYNFEATSSALSNVGNNTKQLVGDGGKLQQLVNSLNRVIIEDKNFVEITKKLTTTVELTESNMKMFNEASLHLNEWVRKQRNFVDNVQLLIVKLEELNKMRDYNETFWKNTRRSLEEGVGIISSGSKKLVEDLKEIDKHFYERLGATLAELDTCIQAMVQNKRRM